MCGDRATAVGLTGARGACRLAKRPNHPPMTTFPHPALARRWLLLLGGAAVLGCASTDAATEDVGAPPPPEVSAEGPWKGLKADEAVDRFLELAIPYDMSNTYLIANLAESYGADLATAIAGRLAAIPADASDADLQRFLLVRVGCRWEHGHGRSGFAGAPTDPLAEQRRNLLRSLGAAVGEIGNPTYRGWLDNLQVDRECLREIQTLEASGRSDPATLSSAPPPTP